MTKVFYPGAFDPITNGQIDIAVRAAKLFDEVIVGVYARPNRKVLFRAEERVEMAQQTFEHVANISVVTYDGLTVEFAREIGAHAIVRGLRVVSDFEHEFQMALMNRQLAPDIDFVCLMTNIEHTYLSSGIVKEVALLGGDVSEFVPPHVAERLYARIRELGDNGDDSVEVVSIRNT